MGITEMHSPNITQKVELPDVAFTVDGSDEQAKEGDQVIEYGDVRVRVDADSAQYLRGLQIDYVSSLHGGGFKFVNPNANHTCGCGSSFSA